MTTIELLDCGHAHAPHGNTTKMFDNTGKSYCHDCSVKWEKERFLACKLGEYYLCYVGDSGKSITTWTGAKLATINRYSFVRSRLTRTTLTQYWATDEQGGQWFARAWAMVCQSR